MKKYLVIVCLGALFSMDGRAQSSWKFTSAEYAGMLWGEAGNYGQIQTINGVSSRSWFLGLGAGLDYYRFRSLPLFLSLTRQLMPSKNGLFLNLDGGINFPLYHRPSDGYYTPGFSTSNFSVGPYWNAGLGYKIKIPGHKKDWGLSVLGGYSYKGLKEKADTYPDPSDFDYRNKRWSLKVGIML
jgi:hypothetical protein